MVSHPQPVLEVVMVAKGHSGIYMYVSPTWKVGDIFIQSLPGEMK